MLTKNVQRQSEILENRFAGLTYAQIARKLGISRQRVQQLISPPPYVRKLVIDKASGECEICGLRVNGSGHVHHKSCKGEDYNDVENLQLLCISCHRKQHIVIQSVMQVRRKIIGLLEYHCLRCTHSWIPRSDNYPKVCPKCKSPYWDKERINEKQ